MPWGGTGSGDDIGIQCHCEERAAHWAVRDEAIGPLNPSRDSVFERSRLASSEARRAAVTDCHVATCGRSSQ